MKKSILLLSVLASVFFFNANAATLLANNDGTKGTVMSDTMVTAKVKEVLMKDKVVPSMIVKVVTQKGVVTLSGTVKTVDEMNQAVNDAKTVKGVKEVVSKIKVKHKEK